MITIAISERLARLTLEWNPAERRPYEHLRYQYAVTLNFVSFIALALIGGLLTGKPVETMVAAAGFVILRMFSGGFHFRSLDLCTVVTAALFVAIPLIPVNSEYTPVVTAVTTLLVAIKAPTNLRNTVWADSDRLVTVKRVYKCVAVAIVASNFVIGSEVLALAFVAQALLLLPRREVTSI